MLMMFLPFKLASWLAGGLVKAVYSSMRRSPSRGAASHFHACTSAALGARGGNVYSDRAGALRNCGREAGECGLLRYHGTSVAASVADRHLRSALWRESEILISRPPSSVREVGDDDEEDE